MSILWLGNVSDPAPRRNDSELLVKYRARAKTVATPRMLGVPAPSSVRLTHEALMTMASAPEARGTG